MTTLIGIEDSALIVVDIQNDFIPGGALAVKDGDKVMNPLNSYIEVFTSKGRPVILTRDWHPLNHISFIGRGGQWPPHCVQWTKGAEFHPSLKIPKKAIVVSKGTDPDREAYSGFEGTNLTKILTENGVKRVFVGGLATDYCVKNTILDALKEGFEAYLLLDASKGVDVNPGDSDRAISEMIEKGAKGITLADFK